MASESVDAPGPGIRTDRLLLRRWTESDLEPYARLNADPEVAQYLSRSLSRADSDAMVQRIEAGFDDLGYGLWALEVRATGEFIGFTGLALQTFPAPFTPAVEVGWRLARAAWGHGYASEAAAAAVRHGFTDAGLTEIVSMTTVTNQRSRAVMERLGMLRDPSDDFEHPNLAVGHPLRPHVLYRLDATSWRRSRSEVTVRS